MIQMHLVTQRRSPELTPLVTMFPKEGSLGSWLGSTNRASLITTSTKLAKLL
jgi:hypothetical protein